LDPDYDGNVGSYEREQGIVIDEPTLRCHHNPLVGTLGIQEPIMDGSPRVTTPKEKRKGN